MKLKILGVFAAVFVIFNLVVGLYVNSEPETLRPDVSAEKNPPVGYYTTTAVLGTIDVLLHKRGGYISNDIMPPFVFLDNMPSWEIGVLKQLRDISLMYRNEIARTKSQSTEDPNLVEFQTLLNNDSDKWIFPSAEGKYKQAYKKLDKYYQGLMDEDPMTSAFLARADSAAAVLKLMNARLGSLSQRLSASVGQVRKNTDLAGDAEAESAKDTGEYVAVKTPWLEIDNVFYEARGSTWAQINILKAMRIDYASVLEKKNATQLLDQVIRELEVTQRDISSPIILNGGEFGFVPNYSLSMSSYVTRANAGIIDLIKLLEDG